MAQHTNHDYIQAVREGLDYKAPHKAINENIDALVNCALVVKITEQPLTAETRALDAIGVQVLRELKNRADMVRAVTDRLEVVEGELLSYKARYVELEREFKAHVDISTPPDRIVIQQDDEPLILSA